MIHVIKSEEECKNFYEKNNGISLTVPDMDEPVVDMLKRFRRGDDVTTRRPIFNGDTELPDMKKMDFTDVSAFTKQAKENVIKHNNDVKNTEKKIRKAQDDAKKPPVSIQPDAPV